VEIATKRKYNWKELRNFCNSHELEMPKIYDANYGSVRTYPKQAWKGVYGINLDLLFSDET
jgi:hypothetical protein